MAPSHNERNMLKSAAASENLCGSALLYNENPAIVAGFKGG